MSFDVQKFDSAEEITFNDRDDAITDYAAGNLSPAKHALMACLVELNPQAAKKASFQTDLAATMMSDIRPVPLSPFLIGETLAKLSYAKDTPAKIPANDEIDVRKAPRALRELMGGKGLRDITWKSLVPGIAVHDVLGNRRTRDGDRLYLLRAKGGMRMPEHSHNGEEWTLILTGGYVANDTRYARGDLHIVEDDAHHSPHIQEGDDCICLVMTQGPLKMKHWLPKVVQRVVGI